MSNSASPSGEIRDGFQLTSRIFTAPSDTARLDPVIKRRITICNLFANHRLPIRDIARILDEKYGTVVRALIESDLVCERRKNRQDEPIKVERRQSFFRAV